MPASINQMIRKNKKLNNKIDLESRRQKIFRREIHELNLKMKAIIFSGKY